MENNIDQELEDAAIEYLRNVKSPALDTSWQQFDIDIFKAGANWQKERMFTEDDMMNFANYCYDNQGKYRNGGNPLDDFIKENK